MGLVYNIPTPSKPISKASYAIKKGTAAAERMLEILELKNTITSKKNAMQKNSFELEISIKNINFKYETDTESEKFV